MISMQRAQPHPSAGTEGPRRLPIMGLQIAHQGNLLFQVVESLAIHGLLASRGRIRQSAPRSQARMVGTRKKRWPMAPAFTQQHTLSSRRRAHRRRVEGSGERDGSWQCGVACSTESPAAMCSQACWRQRKLKCADGASQSGKMVKVLLHGWQIPRRTQIQSWNWSCACLRRWPWPMMVSSPHSGHRRGSSCSGNAFTPDRSCHRPLAVR